MRFLRSLTTACILVLTASQPALHAQSTVVELNDAGWKALRDGYVDRAVRYFGEALTLRPNDPVLLLGAAAADHARGEQRQAMVRLQRALEINPRLTAASRLLGQIAYSEGEQDLAIKTYEKALTFAPNDPVLTAELDKIRHEGDVHQTFEERRYDRFRVMFEGRAEESLAVEATNVFNSAFWKIGRALGEYPSNTIVAILYTEKQFRDITLLPDWSAGAYDGRIRLPVAGASQKPAEFERVLTHELTHAIVTSMAPRGVPTWLHEGLAQHFDGTDPVAAQRRMRAIGVSVPLKALEGGFTRLNAAAARVAYDESLLAVEQLFERPAFGWSQLLHRLADGQSFEEAIRNFGFSYSDLEAPFAQVATR